ncbi:MAG: hypothetical protein WCB62_16435 [Pseudolabrys sp.]
MTAASGRIEQFPRDSQCDQRCTTATWCFPLTPHCSRKHDAEVQLYAFYVLALDGEDLRRLPLSMRKTNLDRLSARRPEGIFVAPFEQGEIGPDLFRAAADHALDQGQEPGVAGDESRGGNRLVAVTERSTIASETVALTFDTSERAVTALRAV